MDRVNIKYMAGRKLSANILGLLFVLVITMPLSAAAVEVTGTITIEMEGEEVLPGTSTPPANAPVPLTNVKVHLGLLDAPTLYNTYRYTSWSTQTDDNGQYLIFVKEDAPPYIPLYTTTYVLIIILESEDKKVAVHDNERDPDYVACLSTPAIDVANRGVTQADIIIKVHADNSVSYTIQDFNFEPAEDRVTSFAGTTRCAEPVLVSPLAIGVSLPYDPDGLTNSQPDRFGHLAVQYTRTYNAYEFARDGLGKTGITPVRVNGWDTLPEESEWGMAYDCDNNTIKIEADTSAVFGSDASSAVFDIRHEYGHHYMCHSPIAGSGSLPPVDVNDENHDNLYNASSADSWTEGFATYFAAAVGQHNGEEEPQAVDTTNGMLDLKTDGAALDNPAVAGEQPKFGQHAEEYAIASLMWQLSETTGHDTLLTALENSAVFTPTNFHLVYSKLIADPNIPGLFNNMNCDYPQTSIPITGIDCMFISMGFYHDFNGDGFYGDGEQVGGTRWWLTVRGSDVFRPSVPPLAGSLLQLSAVDETAQPMRVDGFNIEIEYDAPLSEQSFAYTRTVSGEDPWQFNILVPGVSSRAKILPVKAGYAADEPLIIESGYFHEQINPYVGDGTQPVPPILADHTFTLHTAAGEGPAGDPTCSDQIDNDGDSLTDSSDPDCRSASDLAEAIQCLQIVAGFENITVTKTDVNGDDRIGLPEAVHALQRAAEIR